MRRKTTQLLAPVEHTPLPAGRYDIYPGFPVGSGKIEAGYAALAGTLAQQKTVILEGYGGVFWDEVRSELGQAFGQLGKRVAWYDVAQAYKSGDELEALLAPFLGGDDPIFGTCFTGQLSDFFETSALQKLQPQDDADMHILYGSGAALVGWDGCLVYLDVPKNEIQFRSRAGEAVNLGVKKALDPKRAYKRMYFVDWVALNHHKQNLLPKIDVMVDAQRPGVPVFTDGATLRGALEQMGRSCFRVRPWFEPGPWGGQWIREKIVQLSQDVPNYAWSFELIVPENGLMLESDGRLLEVSFDCLMFHDHQAVLGQAAERFGTEFPIRFDFLDTFDGGNLSVQCHPRPEYIRRHFGERFTQDETYYILDCGPEAQVYLGFQEGINPAEFRGVLEDSFAHNTPVDIEQYVQKHPAHKHDLFLIPNGTVHCSGIDNLVLEISATPYIFTFKMYDWLRLDLEGKPRPLNIARAFENLYFERQGEQVQELISKPYTLKQAESWKVVHVPTHPEHFYDVVRLEFDHSLEVLTHNHCHIMSLVEGQAVRLEVSGQQFTFSYAETFVVPAAAGAYRLVNLGQTPAKVVQAFVKSEGMGGWKS
ncbi:MAG: class I mannose-6-phosphate isomerase [Meiothermus sp.]|nr:class I mannose-6-phosphate isomerase [Meiothermus sp.]